MATVFLNCKYNKLSDVTLAILAKINRMKGNHYSTSTSKLAYIFQLSNGKDNRKKFYEHLCITECQGAACVQITCGRQGWLKYSPITL